MFESIAAFWAEYGNVLTDGVWDTLVMVVISTAFAYLIGLPLGVALILTPPTASGPTGASTGCWTGSSTSAGPSPSSF
uniref:hypothetical protein n=1 Tax=Dysosmobacter welbionis TaxID=2093857 RepID=UPI00307C1184